MIINNKTNKVCFAEGLESPSYQNVRKSIIATLSKRNIAWEQLPCTHSSLHIWARDYMPVQVREDKFVQFRYEPDYLKDSPEYKPNVSDIMNQLGIDVCRSQINIDGGNVISCDEKVILTDKVLGENPQYSSSKLLDELSELLEAEPVLIPWDRYDIYGHADGMVRYMGESRVLLNNYWDFDRALRKRLMDALSPYFEIEELHYGCHTANSWAYLNFLHVGNDIFVPMLNEETDFEAFAQIEAAFPMCRCSRICGCESLCSEGGALNCSTWNIIC